MAMQIGLLKSYTDVIARMYQEMSRVLGVTGGSYAGGSMLELANRLLNLTVVTSDDYDVEEDFNKLSYDLRTNVTADKVWLRNFWDSIQQLDDHYQEHGPTGINSAVVSLQTMLEYCNTPGGGEKFMHMLSPYFSDLVYMMTGTRPAEPWYYHGKGIEFNLTSGSMASRAVGGAFTHNEDYDPNYAELVPLVEVITAFSGGSAPPTVTIAGTDDEGETTTTWTCTLTGNNPTGPTSTTLSADLATEGFVRVTVGLGSITGVVRGSVLVIAYGTTKQETVVVESVSGSDITAVFRYDHSSGDNVDVIPTHETTPSVANRRIRSVSNITIGTTGHVAGTVLVAGRCDRVAA
jgi:hypothetical protein